MEEIRITLETLYDILRNEKKKEDLQKLNEAFFFDVVVYLKEKKSLLDNKQSEDDLFAAGEREKLEYELRSIKRILKEIYEKREKKIIDIALNRSRTKSDIIDTSAMLREEKDFYEGLIKLLDGYREGILFSLFKGEVPFFERPKVEIGRKREEGKKEMNEGERSKEERGKEEKSKGGEREVEEKSGGERGKEREKEVVGEGEKKEWGGEKEKEGIKEGGSKKSEEEESKLGGGDKRKEDGERKEENEKRGEEGKEEKKPEFKKIKFIHAVPSFVWKDLKVYGPFEEGEETEIWREVADLIIEKGRAVEIGK